MTTDLVIIIPVYDDWSSLATLLQHLDALDLPATYSCRVLVVNDASVQPVPRGWPDGCFRRLAGVDILNLACNLGHQRAIAVGLVSAAQTGCHAAIVMDGDGEDQPADVVRLVERWQAAPGHIISAQRVRRSEGGAFRFFYWLYRLLFRLLTGRGIDFGNFCLIPSIHLAALTRNAGVWNHLAASIVRSRAPIISVPTFRGTRYAGRSNMSFIALVLHGLSALSVFSDIALVRILVLSLVLGVLTMVGLTVVVSIRFLTDLAIPGWASTVASALVIILVQAAVLTTVSVFSLLYMRSTKTIVPLLDAPSYIESVQRLSGGAAA